MFVFKHGIYGFTGIQQRLVLTSIAWTHDNYMSTFMCVHHTMYLTHLSGLFTFMLMLKHINAFVTSFSCWFLTLSLSLSLRVCAPQFLHINFRVFVHRQFGGRCLSVSVCVCVSVPIHLRV